MLYSGPKPVQYQFGTYERYSESFVIVIANAVQLYLNKLRSAKKESDAEVRPAAIVWWLEALICMQSTLESNSMVG